MILLEALSMYVEGGIRNWPHTKFFCTPRHFYPELREILSIRCEYLNKFLSHHLKNMPTQKASDTSGPDVQVH